MRRPVLVLSLSLGLALAGGALAQGLSGVEVEADELRYEDPRQLYEAVGNVRVSHQAGRTLTADWLSVNRETQVGIAVGNVVIRDGADVVRADFAAVNLRTLEAMTTQASLDSEIGLQVTGRAVQRTIGDQYRVEGGTFTACRCPPGEEPRPWQVDVEAADIKVGGYAIAKGVTVRVLDVPVFYTPWLVFPVKTERQTGFLLPAFGRSSRGGNEFELPFFWAARHNLGVVLRPRYFTDRGLKSAAEIEYLLGERAWGQGGFAHLPDDDEVRDDPDKLFSENRGAWWLRHEHPLGPGVRFGLDLARISDNNYPLDFEDLADEGRNARFLESSAWASFARSGWYAGLEAAVVDDLQSPNDLDRDDFLLQRLPDLELASIPRRLGPLPLLGAVDLRYTYFHHDADDVSLGGIPAVGRRFFDTGPDGLFDAEEPDPSGLLGDPHGDGTVGGPLLAGDSEGDGVFQEGELLADFGHRIDLYPRLSLPVRFGWVETLSELGYRATFYSPDRGGSETRGLLTGRFEVTTHLGKQILLGGRSLSHVIEPKLAFAFISDDDQAGHPLFIPRSGVRPYRLIDGDLRVLLRDPSDRIGQERLLLAALGNRFYTRSQDGPRLIGGLRLGAGYDFERSSPAHAFLDADFHPHPNLSLLTNLGYDTDQTRISEADVSILWRSEPRFTLRSSLSERRNELRLSYRYLRDLPLVFEGFQRSDDVFDEFDSGLDRINQFNLLANVAAARQVDLFASGYLSLDESSTTGGRLGLAFLSACACWELIASVERRTRPDDTRFAIELRLAGLGFQPLVNRPARIRGSQAARSVDADRAVWDPAAP